MKKAFFVLIIFLTAYSVFAAEFADGRVKLVINEDSGRFSLYYMADLASEAYVPFFVDEDPRTSFLSVMVNNRNYKMGESSLFRTSLGGTPSDPALVFESSFLTVTEQFSFVKTGTSQMSNGVMITITVTNKSAQDVEAGIRFLVDTVLGEKDAIHFSTDTRQIYGETIVDGSSDDRYWVSENNRFALVGSIRGQNLTVPDAVIFSNWKRLNDAVWKPDAVPERNFNLLPYSVDDSAVSYYYDPAVLQKGNSRTAAIVLSGGAGDFLPGDNPAGIAAFPAKTSGAESSPASPNSIRADLLLLRELVARLDEYAASGEPVSDEELAATSLLISGIKSKYSIP